MKHLVLGTAGHVDHGKTALIKALTNFDCDTHKEEKARGITINLGFTYLDLDDETSLGIVDVPGHKDFIHTMVGGASGIDFVLMVVAADSGIMPQTKEHLNILEVLGIKKGIVVLTKVDLVDDFLLELAAAEIKEHFQGTFLEKAPMVEVSSITGTGLDNLKTEIAKMVDKIDDKPIGNFFRLYADRIFSVKGFGSVITGTVLNGTVDTSTEVYLLPGKEIPLRIKRIERHAKQTDKLYAGDRAAINILGLKKDDFERGMILSDTYLESTTMIDANLSLFKDSTNLNLWSNIIFHSGTFESQAKIHIINKDTLNEGEGAIVQIHLARPSILLNGDKFVIRNTSYSQTLGGGTIIDSKPLHHKRRPQKLIESISKLAKGNTEEQIKTEVLKRLIPISAKNIAKNINKPLEEIVGILKEDNIDEIISYEIEGNYILIGKNRDKIFYERTIANVRAYHKKNPMISYGLTSIGIKNKLGFNESDIGGLYVNVLLRKIKDDGILKEKKDTWIISGHKPMIDKEAMAGINYLESLLKGYAMQTPLMTEIEPNTYRKGIGKDKLKQYLFYLQQEKRIYKIEEDYIHSSIVDSCRKKLIDALVKNNNQGLTISEFRDLTGGNRKICLLLMGQFDKEEIVLRKGDLRVLTKKGLKT